MAPYCAELFRRIQVSESPSPRERARKKQARAVREQNKRCFFRANPVAMKPAHVGAFRDTGVLLTQTQVDKVSRSHVDGKALRLARKAAKESRT